ncbi:MAG TPA: YciI family protein [Candidatus Baltobacterales bacterium]|nr:YciI family protein [Candidatus Baltobacterales bacterium]
MRYMLFIYPDRSVQLDPERRAAIPRAVAAWVSEMDSRGVRLQGHVLRPVGEARTVRVRDGKISIGEGPSAGSDEGITGFNILDCADLDEALEVASKHPVATFGTLELREFAEG